MSVRKSRVWQPEWSAEDQKDIQRLESVIRAEVNAFQALRTQLGYTQAQSAELLKVTQSNISKIESSEVVRLDAIRALVKARGGSIKVVAEVDGREISLAI